MIYEAFHGLAGKIRCDVKAIFSSLKSLVKDAIYSELWGT